MKSLWLLFAISMFTQVAGAQEPAQQSPPAASDDDGAWNEWQFRILDPKVRVYFDAKDDSPEEIDLFRDGSLAAAVELAGFVKPLKRTKKEWTLSLNLGVGIGGQGTTSQDGMSVSSAAPIVLVSSGILFEIPLDKDDPKNNYVGLEVGVAYGRTSDENFDGARAEDKAWYIGVTLKIPPK